MILSLARLWLNIKRTIGNLGIKFKKIYEHNLLIGSIRKIT